MPAAARGPRGRLTVLVVRPPLTDLETPARVQRAEQASKYIITLDAHPLLFCGGQSCPMSGPPYIGCRWTFTDASGSGYVNLGEVRFFDAAGDFLDVITTVANPGGTPGGDYNAERVIDGITRSNSKCWRDTSFVSGSNPSTLAVNFSSAITIAWAV